MMVDSDEPKSLSGAQAYRHPSIVIVICMHCHRTPRPESNGTIWDLVEEFIATPPLGVSHGLCGHCMEEHYPRSQ